MESGLTATHWLKLFHDTAVVKRYETILKMKGSILKVIMMVRNNPFMTPLGTETFVKNLSTELVTLGCEIHIIHGCSSHAFRNKTRSGAYLHGLAHRRVWLLGELDFNLKLRRELFHLVREKFDVVDCHGAGGGAYIFSKLNKTNSLLVYHAHDCMASEYFARKSLSLKHRLKQFVRYKMLIAYEKSACDRADVIIANSYATDKALRQNYGVPQEKIKTIYLGIPDNFANGYTSADPEMPTFLHIATNHERKGTKYLVEALKILHEEYQVKAKALVVGKQDLDYINLANRTGVNADFVGNVQEDALKELYASCTCLIVPSLREGFCLPVIEAASFEKPSIVTNTGSLPELVSDGETGFVVNVGDVRAMASRMYLLTTNNDLRRKMGANAKKRSQLFKISRISKQTINAFSDSLLHK